VLSSAGSAGGNAAAVVYYACVNPTTNAFKYSTRTATCPTGYVKEHWNQIGPAGPPGPPGPNGIVEGNFASNSSGVNPVTDCANSCIVASTTINTTGYYIVTGTVTAIPNAGDWIGCFLSAPNLISQIVYNGGASTPNVYFSLTVMGTANLVASTAVNLYCFDLIADPNSYLYNRQLQAFQVSNVYSTSLGPKDPQLPNKQPG
jgi:hypothetical protein